ncbi:conserved Plasmodium protein, unknown function [Plasmodium malariae]|uniref:Uncharacterized protein n=1 Tax=Plasmodium malariae TaxID=5858 RepID=A0A1C3KYL6_PLAMA|nr:conserved Plasmodium protein, unknown function [Plasmodium malariae]
MSTFVAFKKYDENRKEQNANIPGRTMNSGHRKNPEEKEDNKEKQINANTYIKKNKEKQINDEETLTNGLSTRISKLHTTKNEQVFHVNKPFLPSLDGIKNKILNPNDLSYNDKKRITSYHSDEEIKNMHKKASSCPNLLKKNKIIFKRSESFAGILLHKNANVRDLSKLPFSNNLNEHNNKNTPKEINIVFSEKSFTQSDNTYSEDDNETSEESLTEYGEKFSEDSPGMCEQEEMAEEVTQERSTPTIANEQKKEYSLKQQHIKFRETTKSLTISRDENYEKLPPKKCNSSYFNDRGVIIYF